MMTALLKKLDPSITLLVIEHDMDVAFQLTDRITVLHYGQVVADGTARRGDGEPARAGDLPGSSSPDARRRRRSTPTTATATCCRASRCASSPARSSGLRRAQRDGQDHARSAPSWASRRPAEGRCCSRSHDITGWMSNRVVELGLGLVPQGRRVFPSLSVRENLLVALKERQRALDRGSRHGAVPAPPRARGEPRGQALRWRAADAGHRPRAGDQPRVALDGRADRGPGAPARPRGGPGHRAPQERRACRSCWSSRTSRWPSASPITSTCSRAGASSTPAPRRPSSRTTR